MGAKELRLTSKEMDEEILEDKPTPTADRYRSPSFSMNEIKALLMLIEKYKTIILNKSSTSAVSHAKELAWVKIAKQYNSQGFEHKRSAEVLKTKWENLKRKTKKMSNNIIDSDYTEYGDFTSQIVALMSGTDMCSVMADVPQEIQEELKEEEATFNMKEDSAKLVVNNQQSEDSDSDSDKRTNRSLNFSPQESRTLLKCVKEEKKFVFSKDNSFRGIELKNRAWSRITHAFNKQSPQKRSTKVLRTKFNNMKRYARSGYFKKYFKNDRPEKLRLLLDDNMEVKEEPYFEDKAGLNLDNKGSKSDVDDDSDDANCEGVLPDSATNSFPDPAPDPLGIVFNSDSGLGSSSFIGAYNSSNNEVIKLQKDLLNYQLETAKLERQRIQAALKADAEAQESMAIERSLKLRTARLEAIAAETKLPGTHPGLQFNFQESRAQEYINQYHNSI